MKEVYMKELTLHGDSFYNIFAKDRKAMTDSLKVSEIFSKEHKNVLRDIEEKIFKNASKEFNELNFELVSYKDKKGETRKKYNMTRNGFVMLAMGYNGKKAMQFKEAYINRFDEMQEIIETRLLTKDGNKYMIDTIEKYLAPEKFYIYSNESNMINKIVLGMSAKKFKELYNLQEGEPIRDNCILERLTALDEMMKANANLIIAGIKYHERKQMLTKIYEERYK